MINYLIIENEDALIEKITRILDDFHDFNCIGYSYSYEKSMDIALREMPNLIFINVDSARNNPFGLVKELHQYLKTNTEFIAISSSKEMTYDAIKTGFFDYLLSPITELEIRKAILRFKKKHPTKTCKTICLKSYKDYKYLSADEILFLKADNNATDLYMNDGNMISAFKTLKTFEKLLPQNFLRIHRSYIINRNYVCGVNLGKLYCTIKKSSQNVPFTKTYIDNVKQMIKSLSQFPVLNLN